MSDSIVLTGNYQRRHLHTGQRGALVGTTQQFQTSL